MNLLVSSLRSAGKVGCIDLYEMVDYKRGSGSRKAARKKAPKKRRANRIARRLLKQQITNENN
jgi:hypothetical protein